MTCHVIFRDRMLARKARAFQFSDCIYQDVKQP